MKKILITSLLALAATTSSFAAVKGGKFGANFSYSASTPTFGVWWHLTDMIALTPSIGWTNKTTTSTGTETNTNEITFGLGLPIYLANFKALDLFVAPDFAFTTTSSKTTTAGVSGSTSASNLAVGAALGLQVQVHDQVHLYGAYTLGYSKDDPGTTGGTVTTKFGTNRTAIGAIFYFN